MDKRISIEDELSVIWQRIYDEIVHCVTVQGLVNQFVDLANCYVKFLLVDDEGFLYLINYEGEAKFAEYYEDSVLYEVYNNLSLSDKY